MAFTDFAQPSPFRPITREYQWALCFGRPPLRLVVDVDQAEPLRVALGPLEVVQQRPVEVPAQVDARLDRVVRGPQVGVEERDAVGVDDVTAVADDVRVGRAVLRDVQRHLPVAAVHLQQRLGQPGRLDLPAGVGAGRRRVRDEVHVAGADPLGARRLAARHRAARDAVVAVVVHAEPVDGARDDRGVSVADHRAESERREVGDQVVRVAAAQHRVEEQPVLQAVDPPGRGDVGDVRRVVRDDGVEVQRDAGRGPGACRADDVHRQPVAQQQVVRAATAAGWSVRPGAWMPPA